MAGSVSSHSYRLAAAPLPARLVAGGGRQIGSGDGHAGPLAGQPPGEIGQTADSQHNLRENHDPAAERSAGQSGGHDQADPGQHQSEEGQPMDAGENALADLEPQTAPPDLGLCFAAHDVPPFAAAHSSQCAGLAAGTAVTLNPEPQVYLGLPDHAAQAPDAIPSYQ